MRLVIVSDTHGKHGSVAVPEGDVFIHAGDMATIGTLAEIEATGEWLATLPHRHKIAVVGNHDWPFEIAPFTAERALGTGITYLEDSGVTIEGVTFWGSPWQPASTTGPLTCRAMAPIWPRSGR